ncbi:P-loop nucleoside triphosphate hydrolase superfamily protein with CH (Calponin-like proteiny) domain [Forsythia ovata]|uniref:P-loop nucleoside triphosphate hydrolase superfamily protein with CH (Calponin-like proteiny) domain n=1 Tax=Forsythia ovata TaxID=205694 RepID=A0ABD1TQ99_9LAMI
MADGVLQFNVESVVQDVLQQQGKRLCDIDFASRKAEEASLRRYDASGWLRKMVGVVYGKDLPAQPSEEEFRLGLRSGIILCNVLNKVQPGAVPKVVEAPSDTVLIPDGAALSAYQYFENVRNFLDAIEEMGIPTFEASDLEQGGKTSRIVNCVLALKSFNEWKQGGGNGLWKFGGNSKPSSTGKPFVRKSSEPFMISISRNSSCGEKSLDGTSSEHDLVPEFNETGTSHSLHILVRELLSDKNREDIPGIVENMLIKVKEEFERRFTSQSEQMTTASRDTDIPDCNEPLAEHASQPLDEHASKPLEEHASADIKTSDIMKDECWSEKDDCDGQTKGQALTHQNLREQQQRDIQELKNTLNSAKEDMQILQISYQEEVNNLGKHLHGLANAASKYQKVLEENCKLYNQVQDLRGNIRVYCRVRPFMPGKPNHLSAVEDLDERTITILTPSKYGKEGRKSFTFNKVFGPSASQEEVFADTQPLIRSVLDGYNVCIFAYGQTGSGKTHTMTGPPELTKESVGVNFRALSDLFLISEQRKDTIAYDVSVQMIEIYNEQVRDLLVMDEIRNNSQNGVNVPDANLVHVASTSDVISLMNLGQKNRAVGSTAMNIRSSRSHSCLTVHVQGRYVTSGTVVRGCMHLVDLAGSERVDKSEAVGDRLKEAQHINKSLSALGDVISSLAQKQSHVPYRNSKLTQLLQDSLGGQAKTLMFVHISPEPDTLGETISTLKFAERVSTVELGTARANKESAGVKELKQQIASLKAALARKEGESGNHQYSISSSPERVRINSSGSSPSRSWHGDASKSEVRSNSSSLSRRQSLELQDMLINSPHWPPVGSPGLMDDEKEGVPNDWIDKIMLNKQNGISMDNHPGKCEDNRQLPEMFFQKYVPDASKLFPEQPLNKVSIDRRHSLENDMIRGRYETAATDDSDELDAATSDSSEHDYQWQHNVPRASSIPNIRSKLRRPSPKQTKIPEIRSLIPPPPSKRLSNGIISPMHKPGRQPVFVERKQKPAHGT